MQEVYIHFDIDPVFPNCQHMLPNQARFIWRFEAIRARNHWHASRLRSIFTGDGIEVNLLRSHRGIYVIKREIAFSLN